MAALQSLTFGDLLRCHRREAGLSQEELAERTGLSTDAIGLLERGARRQPRRQTLDALADALGLTGAERERFLTAARTRSPALAGPVTAGLTQQPTPIVGRDREVEVVADLLTGDVRLLTLTGPGGVGKTRLALAVAARLSGRFPRGVNVVSLAPITDPTLVVSAVARAVGVPVAAGSTPEAGLASALAGREMLLILDNFEQVVEAASLVAAWVAASPRLRILVTSRAALRVRGEREFPVEPLRVPATDNPTELARNAAVTLFVERARAVLPSFALTPPVAATIAAICRRVDGLPLAIELAAGRIKLLPPAALLARLDDRFAVLGAGPRDAPARHQSLQATLTWSHDLLRAEERVLFRRLAVFVGGWTVEAAEVVCADAGLPEDAVLDGLGALSDQSLLVRRNWDGADPRLDMLETIREYAVQKLLDAGEADALRARHAAYFLALAERAEPRLRERGAAAWFARLEPEHDNLRAVLRWAADRRAPAEGLRLAAALAHFWFIRGHYVEGRAWLERFLADVAPAPAGHRPGMATTLPAGRPPPNAAPAEPIVDLTQARALEGLAALVYNQGEYPAAAALLERSLARYQEQSDRPAVARALTALGGVLRDGGDRTRAIAVLEESLAWYRDLADRRGIAHALVNLGSAVYFERELERAEALLAESVALYREIDDEAGLVFSLRFLGQLLAERNRNEPATALIEESLALSRKVGDRGGTGAALTLLGHLARDRGDLDRAGALFKESLASGRGRVTVVGMAFGLEGLAGVEAQQGRMQQAARLLGAAATIRAATGAPPRSYVTRHLESDQAAVRAALGPAEFATVWAAWHGLAAEQVLALALTGDS